MTAIREIEIKIIPLQERRQRLLSNVLGAARSHQSVIYERIKTLSKIIYDLRQDIDYWERQEKAA